MLASNVPHEVSVAMAWYAHAHAHAHLQSQDRGKSSEFESHSRAAMLIAVGAVSSHARAAAIHSARVVCGSPQGRRFAPGQLTSAHIVPTHIVVRPPEFDTGYYTE